MIYMVNGGNAEDNLVYDVIVWRGDGTVRFYTKTYGRNLKSIQNAFADLRVETITTEEQIKRIRELNPPYPVDITKNIELPHEYNGRKGREL